MSDLAYRDITVGPNGAKSQPSDAKAFQKTIDASDALEAKAFRGDPAHSAAISLKRIADGLDILLTILTGPVIITTETKHAEPPC